MIDKLIGLAWQAREYALPIKSGTKVGCAIFTDNASIVTGFNIEGLWGTSIHAEVCAITRLPELYGKQIYVIAIVAETERFTPCGACLDWIFQFGHSETMVYIENKRRERTSYVLEELMPHYPKQ